MIGANTSPRRRCRTNSSKSTVSPNTRKWHLGRDDAAAESTKRHYKFAIGDFKRVHRCAVLAAESRAGQYKYLDIELAAAHLHGMLEELK
jgi:hypothetical protein